MKILFVSSEVAPFSKTGGLADVSGALPKALAELGHDVAVMTPFYSTIKERLEDAELEFDVRIGTISKKTKLKKAELSEDVPVFFIDQPDYFDREALYATSAGDYSDNHERFAFFSFAVIESTRLLGFQPEVIHVHDWQCSLIPVYLKTVVKDEEFFGTTKTVLTIHNLGYQGLFEKEILGKIGLPDWLFNPDYLEFWGRINYLKGGIVFSDAVTTVSECYAREIQTAEQGMGLDGLLRANSHKLFGILNGVDYSEWNPKKDKYIERNFSAKKLSAKSDCKEDLQRIFKLKKDTEIPLIGMIGRLTEQKGYDLVAQALPDLMIRDLQLVILGTGEEKYHRYFDSVKDKYKGKLGVKLAYDNELAHKIEAGADMFLMPSLYEPCGLNQMYSLKYGTVPIVRATGGLDDTVHEHPEDEGTGFKFHRFDYRDMLDAVDRALKKFQDKKAWRKIMLNGMALDFSWHSSALKYSQLFENLLAR